MLTALNRGRTTMSAQTQTQILAGLQSGGMPSDGASPEAHVSVSETLGRGRQTELKLNQLLAGRYVRCRTPLSYASVPASSNFAGSANSRWPAPSVSGIDEQVQLVDQTVGEHARARACRCR